MGVVEILGTFGVVGCIASLVSARGRRLGDVFAGTLVVRERVPTGRAVAVPPPPPWLVGRFAHLDLSAVPDGLWLAIRQYLTRMHQLDAGVGGSIAQRLADDLAGRTGVPVPQGVPAAAYLAAVVNERQARDVRRVMAAARRGAPGTGPAPVPTGAVPTAGLRPAGVFRPDEGAASAAVPAVPSGTSPAEAPGGPPATGFSPPAGTTGFAPPA